MRIKFSIFTALFLSLFLHQVAWAETEVQASVSDNSIFLGDMIFLTITVNDSGSEYQLDTKPLEQNFKVFQPSEFRNNSNNNGKITKITGWKIPLQAKRIGELSIPALKIANLTTEPIKISIKKPSLQATKTKDNQIFIENSVDKQSLYVGQPLIFTSKIFIHQNSNNFQLKNLSNLSTPSLDNATVTPYGEGKQAQIIREGIRYNTITQQYTIDANNPGTFTIYSPLLTGTAWTSQNSYKPFNVRGDSLKITIKKKPTNYQGKWLVSEDVRLFEDSKITKQSYHAGEPITRTITLQIANITKDKMPNISFNYPKNLRLYPDQDELTEGDINNIHYAQRVIRHAIIADKAGKLTLPEIKLAWWNSKTDKQDFAILPAQTLTILAAEKSAQPPVIEKPVASITETQCPPNSDTGTLIIWQIICAVLFFALITLSLYHLYYRRTQNPHKENKPIQPVDKTYTKLQETLNKQQASLAYQALLHYGQSEYPNLKSLSHLAEQTNLDEQDKQRLASAIKELEYACSNPSETWDSAQLCSLIKKLHQQKNHTEDKDIMNLNPS